MKKEKKVKKDDSKEIKKLEETRYMMATKAIHKLGDISREKPDICVIFDEDTDNFIGKWVMGLGYFNVRFPKKTTRELTEKEKKHYHGMTIQVGGYGCYTIRTIDVVNMADKYLKKEFTVRTRNSTYHFGRANQKGERKISKVEGPLEFSRGRIEFLAIGERMEVQVIKGPHPMWYTSTVKSIS
jgi:hypothetical protein